MTNDWLTQVDTIARQLFARDEFTSTLLSRHFTQTIAWVELAVVMGLATLAWFASVFVIQHRLPEKGWRWLRHLLERAILPLMLLLFGTMGLLTWWLMVATDPVWLRLMVFAANWMLAIRLIVGVCHILLPNSGFVGKWERLTSGILWFCFLLWVSGLGDLLIAWMQSLQFSIGASKLNLYTILTGLLWVGIIMMLMMSFSRWISGQLMRSQHLDLNLRIVLGKITQAALMVLSFLIALPLVGIDLTVLSVFGGALGVGVGFGLQKIASNYISGFIILADRSIRPGDRLTVNQFTGYVTEITSRFVVLRSSGGQEALIPNEVFVSSTVINESYTGKSLYQSLDVQVAYHTDLSKALRILKEAAAQQERVEGDPSSFLIGFGDNGINLRVGFWVKDPENGFLGLNSAILMAIWQRFNEEKISFPFPQREVRILPEAQNPSDLALLKAKMQAKESTVNEEAFDDEN